MTSARWKLAVMLFAAVIMSATAAAPSRAVPRICSQLQAEFAASSGRGGGSPAQVRKYDAAIVRQREQIAKARGQSRGAGCGFSLFGGNVAECAALNATVERMNVNLDALQRKRARLAGGGGSRRDRQRIMASLDANGCRDQAGAAKRQPSRKEASGNLFDQLFDGGDRRLDALDERDGEERSIRRAINQPDSADSPRAGGAFRTLCVRTCDGYFFPMSNAASLGDFERDQKNCESSCPGAEIQVFYTRGMNDDSATMTSSVTGRPYSELPTAYLYKQPGMSRPPQCGCNAPRGFEVIAGNPSKLEKPLAETGAATAGPSPSFVQVPASKPDMAAKSETLDNGDATGPVAPSASTSEKTGHKVRVVGPTFLPDPEAAINLQAPARKKVQ